ncbi:MAG: bifunctional 23S rRNA (guanine(2069)-N(7))-methyltransferase RlmK/23S rRNA (guanine(2445)-N(2))-methyltransferase RlmL [Granulosicoccaceae bacterium]
MLPTHILYATCAPGLPPLLEQELRCVGASQVSAAGAGVRFEGTLETAYSACLWSRLANRILLPLHSGPAKSPEELYELVQQLDWSKHMALEGTLAVDFFTSHSEITHSQYGALKVKDAIVDQFREKTGSRPNVDRDTPSIRVNVYLYRNKARIALDLSGSSLHRRGYRHQQGMAPLKENLAAALLIHSKWHELAAAGECFVDPMCGTGTLLIEAVMIASNKAPGIDRGYFGFLGWAGHDDALWQKLLADAKAQQIKPHSVIAGSDIDKKMVSAAKLNLEAAGLEDVVSVETLSVMKGKSSALSKCSGGLLLSNPPYGERLAGDAEFYADLGRALSEHYPGWRCGLFTADSAPSRHLALPLKPELEAANGGIECHLLAGRVPGRSARTSAAAVTPAIDTAAFANRLRKNLKASKSWRKREGIRAWRTYDADLPEFAMAIDVYDCEQRHVVVQEYQAPPTVNVHIAQERLDAVCAAIPQLLEANPECVHLKTRRRQAGKEQYQRMSEQDTVVFLNEKDVVYELNLSAYLDTGLFLDHRKVRRYVQGNVAGKRFLNLFSYTGAVTAAAIVGGASYTHSVDMSNKYCQWAIRNVKRNAGDAEQHRVSRSDVTKWLNENKQEQYDLILLDPPTFSNSNSTEDDWNLQRDHTACIDACMELLAPGGELLFSNNFRQFKLDKTWIDNSDLFVKDRSKWSIDQDYFRSPRIHQCWSITKH